MTAPIDLNELSPLCAELHVLRKQVTELQAKGTKLELENRRYKRLYAAARALLQYVLLDSPLVARLHSADGEKVSEEGIDRIILQGTASIFERVEQLENDSAVQTAFHVRQMIEKAEHLPFTLDAYGSFLWTWVNHFKHLLGIPTDVADKKDS